MHVLLHGSKFKFFFFFPQYVNKLDLTGWRSTQVRSTILRNLFFQTIVPCFPCSNNIKQIKLLLTNLWAADDLQVQQLKGSWSLGRNTFYIWRVFLRSAWQTLHETDKWLQSESVFSTKQRGADYLGVKLNLVVFYFLSKHTVVSCVRWTFKDFSTNSKIEIFDKK